jgi:amidase
VATAAGLCFAAIGTDTGGSIRFPSSANGLVGLKPTYGRVSRHGVLALSPSLDHVGPMARSVADVAIMFDAIVGTDSMDSTTIADASPSTSAQVGQHVEGIRIGIDREYATKGIDAALIGDGYGVHLAGHRRRHQRGRHAPRYAGASSEGCPEIDTAG